MANVIISNPTDRQLEQARALWRIRRGDGPVRDAISAVRAARARDGLSNEIKTEASKRMWEKRKREQAMTPTEITKLKIIPWDTVAKTLMRLNPTIRFTQLPDAKVGIGFKTPTHKEVADWEKIILTPEERVDVKRWGNHQGPRMFLVAASRGWVSPYTDLLTKSMPVQIVCRSLVSILRVLVAHGGFTWGAAEREFGFRLLGPGCDVKREFINVTPKQWAENRPVTTL